MCIQSKHLIFYIVLTRDLVSISAARGLVSSHTCRSSHTTTKQSFVWFCWVPVHLVSLRDKHERPIILDKTLLNVSSASKFVYLQL